MFPAALSARAITSLCQTPVAAATGRKSISRSLRELLHLGFDGGPREVPYDQTGGAWSPQNRVTSAVRIYRNLMHLD